jgi:hypothetical protein
MKRPSGKVYIAVGTYDGGIYEVLRVFAKHADAEAYLLRCEAHHRRRPEPPAAIEDTPENDALHQAYFAKFTRWQDRHPGGKGAWVCDDFLCMTRKLLS